MIEKALVELKEKFALETVLITRSQYGMSLLDENEAIVHLPSIPKAVYDVTGAGDTVVAALGSALSLGADLLTAAVISTAAAGVVVSKVGTSTATIDEISQHIQKSLP